MRHTRTRRTTSLAALMSVVLISLAVLTPHVNATAMPPRTVFAPWPDMRAAPDVELTARRDTYGRWYLDIEAEGFTFSDVCRTVSGPQTVGHAHIYLGEEKIAAAYAPRVWLGDLPPGRHRLRAVLRAQDHRALIGPDGQISGEIAVTVRVP